jgi:hypothetical protein
MFGLNPGPFVIAGLVFVGVASLLGGAYSIGHRNGRVAALAEVRSANDAAMETARRARESLARECRADPARCLRDEFTRDRAD